MLKIEKVPEINLQDKKSLGKISRTYPSTQLFLKLS